MDASVVMTLLGSGHPEQLLKALARPALLLDIARDEVKRDPSSRKPAAAILDALESSGLLSRVTLSDPAYRTFLALVGALAPDDIGDGEAATIAYGEEAKVTIVIDDRKAQRIALSRPASGPILNTLALLSSRAAGDAIPLSDLGDLVFASLRRARMRVPPEFRSWTRELIGAERAAECPLLGADGSSSG